MDTTSQPTAELDRYQFTVRLKGGATKPVTAFRQAAGGPWTIRPKFGGKKKWRTLRVVGQSKEDLALVRKRALAVIQELEDARFLPPAEGAPVASPAKVAPLATIIQIGKAYVEGIGLETKIKAATATSNVSALKQLVRDGAALSDKETEERPLDVLTAALLERWQDAGMRRVQHQSEVVKARTRRSLDAVVRKARSLFTTPALNVYRKAGLNVPDLKGFLEAPLKGNWNAVGYQPIPDKVIAAMDKAAWGALRENEPGTFLTYLLMLRLGMRNSEVEHARRCWIERRTVMVRTGKKVEAQEVAFMAIDGQHPVRIERKLRATGQIVNIGWEGPKNGRARRVPIAPDVLAQIEALGGEDYLLTGTPTERWNVTHIAIADFARQFLAGVGDDGSGRVKAAYELRKHFGAVVASTQSLERAAEYLGDRVDTTERFYHAWLEQRSARPMLASDLVPQVLASAA